MRYGKRFQDAIGWAGYGFTAVDALMTAGYMLLTIPVWFMAPVYAFFAALGAGVLAFLPMIGTQAWRTRHRIIALLVWGVFVPAFVLNFTWNFGITATMLETNIKDGRVRDTVTADTRDTIKRLQTRADHIRASTTWASTYLAPAAYDKLIDAARLIRDNEAKRGGCGPLCEQKTLELRTLEANKANAVARLAQKAELDQIAKEIAEAKGAYKVQDKSVSEAEANARLISRLATGAVKPGDVTVDWTMIYMSLGASLFVSVMAALCNLVSGLNMAGVQYGRDEFSQPAYAPRQLTTQNVSEPVQRENWRSEYVERTTIHERQDDSLRALQEQLAGLGQQLAGKAQKWQAAGGQ